MRNLLFLLLVSTLLFSNEANSIKSAFEDNYKNLQRFLRTNVISDFYMYKERQEYKEIINLGIKVIPIILERIKENKKQSRLLKGLIIDITKLKGNLYYDKKIKKNVYRDFPDFDYKQDFFIFWWYEGRKFTPKIIVKYQKEYNQRKLQNDIEGAERSLQKIQNLGYDALPYLVDMVKEGETSLIPVVSRLTASEKRGDENLSVSAKEEETLKWWEKNKERFLLPPVE